MSGVLTASRRFLVTPGPELALGSPGNAPPAKVSEFLQEFDAFAGVFTLFLHLFFIVMIFVVQLGQELSYQPTQPIAISVVSEDTVRPDFQPPPPPPPNAVMRSRDAAPLGKSTDAAQAPADLAPKPGQAAQGPPIVPSENRLLNDSPSPLGSKLTETKGTTAAVPIPFKSTDEADSAETKARAAAADTKPAGKVTQIAVPTSPDSGDPGSSKASGEGTLMAAGVIRGAKPAYPIGASRQGLEGRVMLRVGVGPDGRPTFVTVTQSSGHALLDRAARDGVLRWLFTPARRGGTPIASVVDIPIDFTLDR